MLKEACVENDICDDGAIYSKSLLLNVPVKVAGIPFNDEQPVVIEDYEELKLSVCSSSVNGQVKN